MAVRTLTLVTAGVLLVLLLPLASKACFGPKLFVGVAAGERQAVLYALLTLYVQEKTGVESTRVEIGPGQEPSKLIREEQADLVFAPIEAEGGNVVTQIGSFGVVIAGKRPQEELQFTTVLPAINKLGRLLKDEDMALLVDQVKTGASAMAVARKFFMERRWI